MLEGKFPFDLDGQEAEMIAIALFERADCLQSGPVAEMHRVLARRVLDKKKDFHASTYRAMAEMYSFP